MSNDLNGKISQAALEKKVVMDKAAQLEADLKRALKDEKEVRAQVSDYEQRVLSAHQEKETTLSELRVAKGQVESLSAENKQLAAEKKALYLEVEALKAEVAGVRVCLVPFFVKITDGDVSGRQRRRFGKKMDDVSTTNQRKKIDTQRLGKS